MEIEIIWVEGRNSVGNPTWTWTISDKKNYEITKYRGRLYGLLYGLHSTLDDAKDAAVKHFLGDNDDKTLSEDGLRIIPRNEPDPLAATEQSRPASLKHRMHNQKDGKEHHDEPEFQTPQNISPIGPPTSQAGLPGARRGGQTAASVDKVLGEDISPTRYRTDLGTTPSGSNNTGQSMITREMPISDVLGLLGDHGCENVTDQLDTSNFSQYPISAGGYGDVYRGAFRDGSRVAVKCLRLHAGSTEESKKQLKRAAREMYVWSKCNHPNVLGLIGVAQYRDQLAMVSPWMEHGNIRRTLSLQPQVDRYALCAQVAAGVVYLHRVGIVHGDLKGDNILVSGDLIPKLTDFGNSALREYTLQFSNTTSRAGTSLNWVAPEVLGEETGPSVKADVYSLGMTILEIVTGAIPYAGMRDFIIMKKIASGMHPVRPEEQIPSSIHSANLLWGLLKSCWAYGVQDRPTPAEVVEKMKDVVLERETGN